MENAILKEYGIMGIMLLMLFRFIWDLAKNKAKESSDAIKYNTLAVQTLTKSLDDMKTTIAEIPKLKLDVKRSFSAHKIIAGDKWPEVRKEIMEDI